MNFAKIAVNDAIAKKKKKKKKKKNEINRFMTGQPQKFLPFR